jgi:hypothetical protein
MTGYKYEVWEDRTGDRGIFCARVTDPFGEFIGEVKGISEWQVLRLAHELKKGDKDRYAGDHGLCA